MFIAIAIHHAAPEHTDEFVAFMHQVIEATRGAPGLLEFTVCRDPQRGFLAGFSRWESAAAFWAALPTIGTSPRCAGRSGAPRPTNSSPSWRRDMASREPPRPSAPPADVLP